MGGLTLHLFAANNRNTPLATTTTDSTGNYLFDRVPAGAYYIQFIAPNGYLFPLAPLPIGDLVANNGFSDLIILDSNQELIGNCIMLSRCGRIEIQVSRQAIGQGESIEASVNGRGSFQWSDDQGVFCTDCPAVQLSPTESTTYTVSRVNGAYGCTESGQVRIEVLQPFVKVEAVSYTHLTLPTTPYV